MTQPHTVTVRVYLLCTGEELFITTHPKEANEGVCSESCFALKVRSVTDMHIGAEDDRLYHVLALPQSVVINAGMLTV